ncbi:unnamed protein product [marine sediment metagenome]|uniref:Uncharacterized protein n=1 Tax=marine sediment metagenome TaxID=412755 RepID=X0TUH3_9ZZZZ
MPKGTIRPDQIEENGFRTTIATAAERSAKITNGFQRRIKNRDFRPSIKAEMKLFNFKIMDIANTLLYSPPGS